MDTVKALGAVSLSVVMCGALVDEPALAKNPHTPRNAVPPNVIIVMTDDQGYGDLSIHGNPVLRTPNLDRLASESIRLTEDLPDARMLSTNGLGHRRLLSDPGVVDAVSSFAAGADLVSELAPPA